MEVIVTREALEIAVQQAVIATLATFQPKEEQYLTVAEVAARLSVSHSAVRAMANAKTIPWVNLGVKGTKEFRFKMSEVEAALKSASRQ